MSCARAFFFADKSRGLRLPRRCRPLGMLPRSVRHPMPSAQAAGCGTRAAKSAALKQSSPPAACACRHLPHRAPGPTCPSGRPWQASTSLAIDKSEVPTRCWRPTHMSGGALAEQLSRREAAGGETSSRGAPAAGFERCEPVASRSGSGCAAAGARPLRDSSPEPGIWAGARTGRCRSVRLLST